MSDTTIERPTLPSFTPTTTAVRPAPSSDRACLTSHLVQVGHPAGLAGRRRLRLPRGVQRLSGPLLLIGVWALASYSGFLDERTFPPPGAVATELWDLARGANPRVGTLTEHLWASGQRVLKGLTIGTFVGVTLSVLAGLTRRGENLVDPVMQIFKAIPTFALLPFLIMWSGIGEQPKVALIALGTGMSIYINTYGAIRNVDNELVEAASTFGVSRRGLVRHVILPGSVPGFLVGLRLAMAGAWLSLIFAETINAQRGVGFLMSYAQANSKTELMVSVLVIYATIGLASYSFVRFLERRCLAWRRGFAGS